jgi:hypothetical protein
MTGEGRSSTSLLDCGKEIRGWSASAGHDDGVATGVAMLMALV